MPRIDIFDDPDLSILTRQDHDLAWEIARADYLAKIEEQMSDYWHFDGPIDDLWHYYGHGRPIERPPLPLATEATFTRGKIWDRYPADDDDERRDAIAVQAGINLQELLDGIGKVELQREVDKRRQRDALIDGGALIKRAREEAGMTQVQLADWLGTSQAAVSQWESGRSPLPDDRRVALQGLITQSQMARKEAELMS